MSTFKKSLTVLEDLFAKDCLFSLATSKDNVPSVRIIDAFYDDGAFYIVAYAKTQKVREITDNPNVSLCNDLYRFTGTAHNIGHPLDPQNQEIREKLIKVFEKWYFAHNNEKDEHMCYIKVDPKTGFFYKDGTGYKVDFQKESAEEFPFKFDLM